MTVPAFNYHSSIIAIMGKSNKALYTSLLSNLRCVLKLIQNRLKRLVFSWRQATLLPKTTWKVSPDPGGKGMGDPDVEDVETRTFVKPERGCRAVYQPCLRRFYALFLIIIQRNTYFFWPRFWCGCPNEVVVSFRYSGKNIIFATIQHNYAGRWKQNKMESVLSRR